MKTIEEIMEYLERQAGEATDSSLYWHEVYKNTKDKSKKKHAKKLRDSYFNKIIILSEIMRFINDEK